MNRASLVTDGYARPLSRPFIATDGFIESVRSTTVATRLRRPSSTSVLSAFGRTASSHNRGATIVRQNTSDGVVCQ